MKMKMKMLRREDWQIPPIDTLPRAMLEEAFENSPRKVQNSVMIKSIAESTGMLPDGWNCYVTGRGFLKVKSDDLSFMLSQSQDVFKIFIQNQRACAGEFEHPIDALYAGITLLKEKAK